MLYRLAEVGSFFRNVRGLLAAGYCVFLGVLAALSLPPYPFIPLFFVAVIVVLLLLQGQERAWRAFGYGFCFGLGFFGFSLYWVANSFYAQADVPTWLAPVLVTLMVMILSLFPAMAFLLTRLLWHRYWFQRAMAFAALFAFFEFLRGWDYFLPQFPWNPVSLVWWPSDVMLQSLSLGGSAGLGMITILAAGFLTPLFDGRAKRAHRLYTPLAGVLILAAMAGFGFNRLAAANVSYHNDLVIRLVQPNIPQLEKWNPEYLRRNLDRYFSMSSQSTGPLGAPNVLIWGETAVPYDLENTATRQFILSRFPDQTLITGAVRQVFEPEPQLTNSVYVLSGEEEILGRFDKARLVPFGEYVPFRPLLGALGLQPLVPGSQNFDSGPGNRTLTVSGLPGFGTLVCYEVIFSGEILEPGNRPHWILNVTNDAWFGDSAGPRQHFQMARARAIEEGIPVIRVAGTGISAVIDPYGKTLARLGLNERGIIDSRLPERNPKMTVFSRFGLGLAGFLAALFFGIGAGSGRPERSRKE